MSGDFPSSARTVVVGAGAVGCSVAYTYLPPEFAEPGTDVEILYEGDRYEATVREEPLI